MNYFFSKRVLFILILTLLAETVRCQNKGSDDVNDKSKLINSSLINPPVLDPDISHARPNATHSSIVLKQRYRYIDIADQHATKHIKAIIYLPIADSLLHEETNYNEINNASFRDKNISLKEDTLYNPYFTNKRKLLQIKTSPKQDTINAFHTKKRYPLIIFLHGKSKAGNDLDKLTKAGLPYWLSKGFMPVATDALGNTVDSFIVLAPQHPSFTFHTEEMDRMIDCMIEQYGADSSRIYLTGLSAGGQGTLLYLADQKSRHKIAAAAILSPAPINRENNHYSFQHIAAMQTHVLFQTSPNDKFHISTQAYIDSIMKLDSMLVTVHYSNNKHGQFEQWYNPLNNFIQPKQSSQKMNLYNWFFTFKRRD